jgi:hypothetical protein
LSFSSLAQGYVWQAILRSGGSTPRAKAKYALRSSASAERRRTSVFCCSVRKLAGSQLRSHLVAVLKVVGFFTQILRTSKRFCIFIQPVCFLGWPNRVVIDVR